MEQLLCKQKNVVLDSSAWKKKRKKIRRGSLLEAYTRTGAPVKINREKQLIFLTIEELWTSNKITGQ